MDKKGQVFINTLAGLLIVAGGILVIFNYVNLGLLVTLLGSLIEAIKVILSQGVR